MKKLALLLLCFALPAFGQGSRWDLGSPAGAGVVTTVGSGQPFLVAVPNAQLNFCQYPAIGIPCTNFAPTFTDISLTSQCPSNAQVVLQGSSSCQATGDASGNLGVYAAPGTYAFTLTVGAISMGPFTVSIGGGGGGGIVIGTANQINVVNGQASLAAPVLFPGGGTFNGPLFISSASSPAAVMGLASSSLCLFHVVSGAGQICNLNGRPVWNGTGTSGFNSELFQVRTGQTPQAGYVPQFVPSNQDFELGPLLSSTPITPLLCPTQDDACFTNLTANNTTYQVTGNYQTANVIKILDVLHTTVQCTPGTTIQPLNTTALPIIQIIGGSYVTLKDCEVAGYTYTTGTVTVSNGSTTATLSVAPSTVVQAMMAGGALFIPGSAPLPDTSPMRGQGALIASVSGTAITIPAWAGKSMTNAQFRISYGINGASIQAIDENCSLSGGGTISGDGSNVTVSIAASKNCKIQSGQTVLVYGTGTFGSGATANSYNRANQGPITVVSGCTGVGACSFTYPSTLNLGSGSAGTIAVKTDHIYFDHNNVHDGGNMVVSSQATDTQDAMTEVWMTNNSMSYCHQNCYGANRMSELHLRGNHCDHPAMGGVVGDCFNGQSNVAMTESDDEADVESNNGDGFHVIFLYGGTVGHGLSIHDVPLRNAGGTNNHNFHCDLCQFVTIEGMLIGANVGLGNSQIASGKTGARLEGAMGVTFSGNSIMQVGGAAITANSRLENLGNGFNAGSQNASTASCVVAGANGCTTPTGHQWFNADDQVSHAVVQAQPSDGSGGTYTFTSGALTTAAGVTCTTATTPACITDAGKKLEGVASQKICPNLSADNCVTGGVFPAGRIVYVNFPCTAGSKCIGGNINTLSDFVFRVGIGAPSVNLQAGDIQFCVSSLPNLVAPEACQDVPFIKANAFVYIPFIFPNYGQLFDNPGLASAGFIAKSGGTSYVGFWTDDWAVDIPNGSDGPNAIVGNTVYRSQGACMGISGGIRVNITGNVLTDCGWTGKGPVPFYGIYVDDSVQNSQLDNGPAMVGGYIGGNVFKHTIGISATSSSPETCILLNVGTGGSIDQLKVDTNGCVPSEWNAVFNPTTATNYGNWLVGGVVTTSSAPSSCTSTGIGGAGTCAVAASSTDSVGTLTLTPAAGVAALGAVTLNLSSTYLNTADCQWTAKNGTGTWNARTSFIQGANTTGTQVVNWDNNAAALTAASTYLVSYNCSGH